MGEHRLRCFVLLAGVQGKSSTNHLEFPSRHPARFSSPHGLLTNLPFVTRAAVFFPQSTSTKNNTMKKMFQTIGVAACVLATVILTGCASNTAMTKTHVYQASGKGIKFGIVQDPVTGQYSLGYQSIFAGAMIVPIDVAVATNGTVSAVVPDAVMSYEIGGKGTFFGSGDSTVTFAVGPNAVNTLLGGQHIPINGVYWTNSSTGVSTLPINGAVTPTVTSMAGTNSTTSPIVINPLK